MDIDQNCLNFEAIKLCLRDERDYGLPICPQLKSRLGANPIKDIPLSSIRGGGPSITATPVVNTNCILSLQPNDNWQIFLRNLNSCPIQSMCLKFHLRGQCTDDCFRRDSHVPITDLQQTKRLEQWATATRAKMTGGADRLQGQKRPRTPSTESKK